MINYIGKRCIIVTATARFEGRITAMMGIVRITRGYMIINDKRLFCGTAYINERKIQKIYLTKKEVEKQ